MGAVFQMTRLPGKLDRAGLERQFQLLQEQDRYENGHTYSGGFGMASGIRIDSTREFSREMEAAEYLEMRCRKWEEAIAVRCGDKWIIGAFCAE